MKLDFKKGFTLLELLVVIAIIGVLAAIVLTQVSASKGKSNDAKVKQNLASLKRVTEVYAVNNGNSYGVSASCASGMFADSVSDVSKFTNTANYPSGTTLTCNSIAGAWAVQASLSASGQYMCADSRGVTTQSGTALSTNTVCP